MHRSPLHMPLCVIDYLPGIRCILLTALGSNYTASKYTWKGCAVENLASESPLRKFKVCYWDSYLDFGSSDADLFVTQLFLEALDRSFAELRDDGLDDLARMRDYRHDNWMFVRLWFL